MLAPPYNLWAIAAESEKHSKNHGTDACPPGSSDPIRWTPVFAGYPAAAEFELPDNLPFHLELLFTGRTDLKLQRVHFTRLH